MLVADAATSSLDWDMNRRLLGEQIHCTSTYFT
jgi:hypothetical protein